MLAALSLALAASAVAAQTSAVGSDTAKAEKKTVDARLNDQTVICRREDTTGTRLGAVKVCHTRAQWAAQAAVAREQMDHIQQNPQTH